jgi:transcription elongation factor Elf1
MILELIVGVLTIVVGGLSYACYNLLKKIEVYEEWVDEFRTEVNQMYARLKEVDDRNLFEPDEDVGFIFSEIVRITKEFNEKVK